MATVPNRTLPVGRGPSMMSGRHGAAGGRKPVGFGLHGHPFFNLQKYHQSKAFQLHGGAMHPGGPGHQQPVGPEHPHPGHGGGHPVGFPMPPGMGGGHHPLPGGGGGVPGTPGGPPLNGGYHGLDGILSILQKGINQQQLSNMAGGATGTHNTGVIGGVHGAFSGLSPAAVHFLATSGLLQAQAPTLQDTNGLGGDDLFKAQFMNNLLQQHAQQNPVYQLHSGIDANFLTNALKTLGGAYAKGYNATGSVSPMLGNPISA